MGPTGAIAAESSLSKIDSIYSALLAVLAFFQLIAAIMYIWVAHMPGIDHNFIWAMYFGVSINLLYFLFEAAVLIIRIRMPQKRKWPTFALNIAILLAFPFGTALGIWGLI